MKLFRLLSTTAATVLAIAALAVSASAMTATYDETTGKATITGITHSANAEQQTLLILNKNTDVQVTEADITQIGQESTFENVQVMVGAQADLAKSVDDINKAALAAYETELAEYTAALATYTALTAPTAADHATLKVAHDELTAAYNNINTTLAANPSQTYFVRVGGAGEDANGVAFDACELTVPTSVTNSYELPALPEKPEEEEPEVSYKKGDADGSGKVNLLDLIAIRKHMAKKTLLTGAYLEAANANNDANGAVNLLDLIAVRKHMAKKELLPGWTSWTE